MNKATDETAGPILTNNMSKRVSPWEVRTFGDQNNDFTISGEPPCKYVLVKLQRLACIVHNGYLLLICRDYLVAMATNVDRVNKTDFE